MTAGSQAPCYLSQSPIEPACCHSPLHPSINTPVSSFFSLSDHSSTSCCIFFLSLHPLRPVMYMYMCVCVFWFYIYLNRRHCSTKTFRFPPLTFLIIFIHCRRINHIRSLCFNVSSSSNTPLSIPLQAVDERTLLVMVEQRRSPDASDRPAPFISLVPDAV